MSVQGLLLCRINKWDIRFLVILICTSITLSAALATAATDWGTTGVADTSRVANIVQLTTDQAAGESSIMGGYSSTTYHPRSWRQDGQWIAFSAQMDGTNPYDFEICRIKPDGSSFQRLTTNSVNDSNASFSADNRIYYNVNTDGYGTPIWTFQNWRMNEDGSGQEKLSAPPVDTDDETAITVSPDGTMIAYRYNNGALQVLMVANADGSSSHRVSGTYAGPTDIVVQDGMYSWSPDSQWLVYSGTGPGGSWLYKVRPDGSGHSQLTNQGTDVGSSFYHYTPVWSPDGSSITYISQVNNTSTTYELRTVNPAGTTTKILDTAVSSANPGWVQIPYGTSWSPDSQWIAYTKDYYSSTNTPSRSSSIFIVNVADEVPAPAQLTSGFNDEYPIWSPAGSQILFQSPGGYLSREDACSPFCSDSGDILLLNLTGDYGSSVPSFPWHMFLPAIENNTQK